MKFETDKKGLLALRDGWLWVEPKPLVFSADVDTVIFAITLPIAEPLNMDWPKVDETLDVLFKQNDVFFNWAIAKLFKAEPIRTAQGEKYKSPTKKAYNQLQKEIYNGAGKLFPELPSSSVASALKKCINKIYNKKKISVFHGREAVPYFKENQPLYLPEVSINVKRLNMCGSLVPVFEFLVSRGRSHNRLQLRLQAGDNWGRENGVIEDIMSGNVKLCACSILKEYVGGVHHHTATEKDKNKNTTKFAYKVKLVVKRPVVFSKKKTRTMVVSTFPDTMLAMWIGGVGRLQVFHADNLPRWYAEEKSKFASVLDPKIIDEMYGHVKADTKEELKRIMSPAYAKQLSEKRREFLDRFSDDRKTEYRSGQVPAFNAKSKKIAEKWEMRTDSFVKQTVAMVVGYAKRKHCDEIAWDDSNGVMLAGVFPWFKLKATLQHAAKMNEITFVGEICEEPKKKS